MERDDTISRQAAIEVLGVFTQTDVLGHTPKQIVEALPSAQPEIIKCRECRYKELKGVDYYCDHITGEEIMVSPNDYCSWAERGTDG